MLMKVNLRIVRVKLWTERYSFSKRNLASWSSVAYAFNSKPSIVKSFKSQFLGKRTGIFGYREVQEPYGLYLFKEHACRKADLLTEEIKSPDRKRKMARIFDELSDTLCKVADLAEFIRLVHPLERFSYAASETSTSISSFVEELNTNRELYDKLKAVVEKGDVCPTDPLDDYIARQFLLDFEQSGIHLDQELRDRVVAFNDYILHLGSNFMNYSLSPRTVLKSQLPESIRHLFTGDGETVVVGDLFSECEHELIREAAYKIYLYPDKHHEELLHELLMARLKLANLCGYPTYADRTMQGSLAATPEFVHEFLRSLGKKIKPKADENFRAMLKYKQELNKNVTAVMPWDVSYIVSKLKQREFAVEASDYSPYFSLGACMDGLNLIFKSLYNITLQVEDAVEGELWHNDVRKMSVIEGDEILGYIYCDFFERPYKHNQDCHFTIQGGRLCDDGTYQKPIVAVLMNLPNPTLAHPSLLTTSMVDNLFHEMGHAMHSMLGRTTYQHVTGTRCATDLAEVPSVLMEYFASDPRVVSKYARHFETGKAIPYHLVSKLQSCKKKFLACETQLQVFYATYDQACHSKKFLNCSTTELLAQIQNSTYGLPHVPNTAWQLRFGHLVSYGAKYYSYLMSRSVASWIWHKYFRNDPFNQTAGKKYRSELLAYGASKPPRELVENFLGTKLTPECLSDALFKDINSEPVKMT